MALSRTNVSDKLLHFGTYSFIAFIPAFGLGFRTAIRCIVATELVGIGLEIVQRIVPDRSFDLYDVLANTMVCSPESLWRWPSDPPGYVKAGV